MWDSAPTGGHGPGRRDRLLSWTPRQPIERLHEEFRRREKTQGSLPGEDTGLILLFSLVASGQIKLRRIAGWRKIASVLRRKAAVAA
jgi:hypothetical protein